MRDFDAEIRYECPACHGAEVTWLEEGQEWRTCDVCAGAGVVDADTCEAWLFDQEDEAP